MSCELYVRDAWAPRVINEKNESWTYRLIRPPRRIISPDPWDISPIVFTTIISNKKTESSRSSNLVLSKKFHEIFAQRLRLKCWLIGMQNSMESSYSFLLQAIAVIIIKLTLRRCISSRLLACVDFGREIRRAFARSSRPSKCQWWRRFYGRVQRDIWCASLLKLLIKSSVPSLRSTAFALFIRLSCKHGFLESQTSFSLVKFSNSFIHRESRQLLPLSLVVWKTNWI